jgi:multiple sugar transport system substrate-binding protein
VIELRGTTWDHPRGWGGVRAAAEAFASIHPDVRVRWDVRSLQAFADQPVEQLAEGSDLIVLDHPAIGQAVARGALVPLDEQLDDDFLEEQATSSVGRSHESYTWNGHQWALAIDAAAQVAAYRPDLLERAGASVPRTWDDVRLLSDALRTLGSSIAMPAIPVDAACAFLGACRALGGEPFGAQDGVVAREVGREALGLLRDVVARCDPRSLGWNPPTALHVMATTDEVVYVPLTFLYASFAREGVAPHLLRFAAGPVGAAGVPSGTLGGAGLAVSASSSHPSEACAYAAFTASADVQRGVYARGGGQPGHRAAWIDREVNATSGGAFADTLDALDAAYLRPRDDGFIHFQDEAGDLVHAHLRDGGDVDEVLDAVDASYRSSLGSRAEAGR